VDTLNPGFGWEKARRSLYGEKTYSREFRRDAVELYRVTEGATITQIAGDRRCRSMTAMSWSGCEPG